jgi:monoamine oxidase
VVGCFFPSSSANSFDTQLPSPLAKMLVPALLSIVGSAAGASVIGRSPSITFQDNILAEAGGMQNVHIEYAAPLDGELSLHYGSCDVQSSNDCHHTLGSTHVGNHELAKRHSTHDSQRPTKFVWLPPHDAPSTGCLHAFSGETLVGRSSPISMARRKQRRSIAAADIMDAEGPWFDGVQYLQEKEPGEAFVASAKSKTVGILGGGMSGLMTSHLLDSVGIKDWTIIEASSRIGGRVHTSYLNGSAPEDYQYQEMGPMRFPVSITDTETNDTIQIMDHRMVFQLADVLNEQNGHDPEFAVEFIKWIQAASGDPSSTAKRRPDGTVPSVSDVKANPEYATDANATYSNATLVAEAEEALEEWNDLTEEKMAELATNVFRAHKEAVAEGYFDFSEAGYLTKLGYDSNITDQVDSLNDILPNWLYETVYFLATDWRTIDKGLTRLPKAFGPAVFNRTIFQTAVQGMQYNEHRSNNLFNIKPQTMEVDYAVVAVPFSRVRLWNPMPDYTSLLRRAIDRLNYSQACKVSLHYETRFWEHLPEPIFGGCGSSNIPGIGSVCYPSYKMNSTGPGVILASYLSSVNARSVGALTEEQHVAMVQRAMIEIHGEVAQDQWTGAYDRICWENNEFQAGAWASPTVRQQQLYLPAYFHTEKHTVFSKSTGPSSVSFFYHESLLILFL